MIDDSFLHQLLVSVFWLFMLELSPVYCGTHDCGCRVLGVENMQLLGVHDLEVHGK